MYIACLCPNLVSVHFAIPIIIILFTSNLLVHKDCTCHSVQSTSKRVFQFYLYWLIELEGVSSRGLGGGRYRQWIVCRISTSSSSLFHSQVCLFARCMDDITISVDNRVIYIYLTLTVSSYASQKPV